MYLHIWTQDRHYPGGYDGKSEEVQTFRCRVCGINGIPGVGQTPPPMCGCSGSAPRPKIVRPFEKIEDKPEPPPKHNPKDFQRERKGFKNGR